MIGQHAQRMQCMLQPLQEYVFGNYNRQDGGETLG